MMYSKCSKKKINTFLALLSNKMLVIKPETHKKNLSEKQTEETLVRLLLKKQTF